MEARPSRLRQVPGYGTPGVLETPVAHAGAGSTSMAASAANMGASGGALSRARFMPAPYRTREYLYYEGEAAAAGLARQRGVEDGLQRGDADARRSEGAAAAATAASLSATAVPAGLAQRLAEDAPPVLSLHEAVMTPERRHAGDRLGAGRGDGLRSPMPDALMFATPAARGAPGPQQPLYGDAAGLESVEDDSSPADLEDNWVTVFGFAPGQAATVVAYFSRLGGVVRSIPGQGTWVHVCYATRWAAQRALAKNASVVPAAAPGAILGVVPMRRALASINTAADSLTSSLEPEAAPDAADDAAEHARAPKRAPPSIFARPSSTPTDNARTEASDSLLTRALGVVFGW